MMSVGLRESGIIPYRNKVLAEWIPGNEAQPWWNTVHDSMQQFPFGGATGDYGWTPGNLAPEFVTGGNGTDYTFHLGFALVGFSTNFEGTTGFNLGISYEIDMDITALNPAYNSYNMQIGLSNDGNWAGNTTYIGFKASLPPSYTNQNTLLCLCANFDGFTTTSFSFDSGVPVLGVGGTSGPMDLKIIVAPDGSSAGWYLNGTQIARCTNAAAIPHSNLIPMTMQLAGNIAWYSGGDYVLFTTGGGTVKPNSSIFP